MISALGSHRFNPQTGLWELVSLENVAGVEMSLPAVAEVGGLGADGPGAALPEPVTPLPSDDVEVALPVEPADPCDPVVVFPPPFANRGLMVINGIYHGSYTFDRNDLGEDWWAAEQLNGGLGRDVLIGDDLSNDLNGGAGADVMIGGGGQDIYWVDDAGDVVIEYGNGGRDVVISSASYTLSAHVEKLVLAWGAGDINGTGNDLDNILVGNEGKNVLSGGPGNDFLYGGGGGDTLIGGEGQDVFTFGGPVSLDVVVNVILDFEVGVDKIANMTYWPLGIDEDRASALPCMWQEGTDTILAAPWGLEIRLVGIDMRLLSQDDFVFTQQLFIPV